MIKKDRHTQLHDTLRCLRTVAVSLVLCFTAQSCHQDTDLTPDLPTQDGEIQFHTSGVGTTRGLIESLEASGTEVCLYGYRGSDYLAQGKSKQLSGKPLAYKDGRWSVIDESGNPVTYFWEGEGYKYRFFGWLGKDATGLTVPNTWSYDESTKKLIIPETVLGSDYNQFDFLYSDVVERDLDANNKRDPVNINMHHLFTAFGIGINNTSEDDIYIKSITLGKLHDSGSATIDFSTTPCTVNYGATSISRGSASPFISFTGDQKVDKEYGIIHNVFRPTATAKEYYMVWPQAADIFTELKFDNEEQEANEPDNSFPIILEYSVGTENIKKRLQLPKQNWEPGKLYYFDILIADKLVQIETIVNDWNYYHTDANFSDGSVGVKAGNHLVWDESTCRVVPETKTVYVTQGQSVKGSFTIDTPAGGRWYASLEGDVTAFTIMDDTTPTDDGFGPIDGEQHTIRIVPLISNPDRDYSVKVKFLAERADGKRFPADDMVQDYNDDDIADRYTIVLESVN